jgi:hypothetical protein
MKLFDIEIREEHSSTGRRWALYLGGGWYLAFAMILVGFTRLILHLTQ